MRIVRIVDTRKAVICQIKNGHAGDTDEAIELVLTTAVQFRKRLVVDMRFVDYFPSDLVISLVALQQRAKEKNVWTALGWLPTNILEVIRLTNLDMVFWIITNLDNDLPPQASCIPKRPRPSGDSGYADF